MRLPPGLVMWINVIPIPKFGHDTPFCTLSKGSHFDTKYAYNLIWNSKFPYLKPDKKWTTLWKARCPPKIRFFLCLSMWHRLPTASLLASRQVIPNNNCPFCPNSQEDITHIFLNCPSLRNFGRKFSLNPNLIIIILILINGFWKTWIVLILIPPQEFLKILCAPSVCGEYGIEGTFGFSKKSQNPSLTGLAKL